MKFTAVKKNRKKPEINPIFSGAAVCVAGNAYYINVSYFFSMSACVLDFMPGQLYQMYVHKVTTCVLVN